MNRFLKYALAPPETGAIARIEMPAGAKVLSVQVVDGEPFIYALANTSAATETRAFAVYCTGADAGVTGRFLGTFVVKERGPRMAAPPRSLVFHVFDVDPTPNGPPS